MLTMAMYDDFDIPMLTRKAASQRLLGDTVLLLRNRVLKMVYLMSKLPCPEYANICELRIIAL